MSEVSTVADQLAWERPPPGELEPPVPFTFPLEGAVTGEDEVKVRLISTALTSELVEFAVVQMTMYRGRWRNVLSIDSCHDLDVHQHGYGRSQEGRVGDPEPRMPLSRLTDVQDGYDIADDLIFENWVKNRRRWRDA